MIMVWERYCNASPKPELLGDMYSVHITYCICTNLYLFITVEILLLDYLKNSISNYSKIFSVFFALSRKL